MGDNTSWIAFSDRQRIGENAKVAADAAVDHQKL